MYPVFLNLDEKDCVVIGGGEVALRKILSLLECGARVRVVAFKALSQIETLAEEGKICFRQKKYESKDLSGTYLIISATNDPKINKAVSEDARRCGVWVNVVDAPELCDFVIPSVMRRGKLAVAVSTEGVSPTLAKSIRKGLEPNFGPEYEIFLNAMDNCRNTIKEKIPDDDERKIFFASLIESDLIEKARMGWNVLEIKKSIEDKIEEFSHRSKTIR